MVFCVHAAAVGGRCPDCGHNLANDRVAVPELLRLSVSECASHLAGAVSPDDVLSLLLAGEPRTAAELVLDAASAQHQPGTGPWLQLVGLSFLLQTRGEQRMGVL